MYQVLLRLIDLFSSCFFVFSSSILLFFRCFVSIFANCPVLPVSFIEISFISSCLFSSLFFSLILRWGGNILPEFLMNFPDDSWQKLTFPIINVSGLGATGLTKILIEIHREDENNNDDFEDCIMYADEITLHKAMPEFGFNGEDKIAGGWIPFPGDEFSRKARIVANPDQTGINTTDKCLWIKREKNDEVFSGAINRNFKVNNLNEFRCMTMMVKKSIAGPVSLELQSPGEEKKQILTADYTEVGRWQKLEFVFPDNLLEGAPLQIIILQAHVVDTKEDASFTEPVDIYVDELYLSSETVSIPLYSKDKKEIVKTEIYDIRGMLMTTFGANEEAVIDNLEKGVYVVRQTDKEGNVTVEKMMNR